MNKAAAKNNGSVVTCNR